jgi:hypothetical protein
MDRRGTKCLLIVCQRAPKVPKPGPNTRLGIQAVGEQLHSCAAGWSKRKETNGKTPNSLCPVAMHPALAQCLREWRKESLCPSDSDWVFPSYRFKGKIPRSASMCGKDYLRPAAVTAGVMKADESVRFGWHNLRHSLATFFGSQEIPVQVIQKMLRQKKLELTLHYTHGVNKQVHLRGCAQPRPVYAVR